MMVAFSEHKKASMKYGLIIGAAAGLFIFFAFYALNPSFVYLFFIPIAAAMGWASQYVRDEKDDEED